MICVRDKRAVVDLRRISHFKETHPWGPFLISPKICIQTTFNLYNTTSLNSRDYYSVIILNAHLRALYIDLKRKRYKVYI